MGHLLTNIYWIISLFSIANCFWINYQFNQSSIQNQPLTSFAKVNLGTTQQESFFSVYFSQYENQNFDFGSGDITPLDVVDTCPSFQVLYVDSSIPVGGNGSNWNQAFKTLSAAVHVARNCVLIDSILVAEGTYYPTGIQNGSNRDSNFAFQRGGLVVLGGYPSGGGVRDFRNNPTILDGDIGIISDSLDNSYHVIVISGIGSTADSLIINGFQIKNGNANGSNYKLMNGVNISREHGGGIIMTSNTSDKILVQDCKIIENSGSKVGGIYNSGTSSILDNLIISGNVSASNGGGVYNYQSSPIILNALFSGNICTSSGGGIYNSNNSNPLMINITIVGNSASNGGGIYNTTSCNPTIKNSIVYGNSSGINAGSSNISYSLVQGLSSTANGNLSGNLNPNFINSIPFLQAPTIAGGYHLQGCSPVINKGNNIAVLGVIDSDLDGDSRIVDGVVDLGVFEFPQIVTDSIIASICAGDSIVFGNATYFSSGIYVDTFVSTTFCDSIVTLSLDVNPIITDSISESICSGDSYLFGGNQISVSGVYVDTFISTVFCDSIVTLTLNVNPMILDSISESICSGDSYLFGGEQLSVSGVYSDTLQSSTLCDSIVTLSLNVNPIITDSISASICFGHSYLFGGQQLSVSGVYRDTLQSSNSCDSVVTLTLNVNPIIMDSVSASICSGDFYLFGGQQLSVSGVYSDTLQSSSSCDSIVSLSLNVNSIITDSISASICSGDFYLFGGNQIFVSGIYVDTFVSTTFCDSIVTLTLNVNPIIWDSISASICSGSSYLFGGQQLSVAGVYSDTLQSSSSCDSVVTLTLNVNPIITDSISASICSGSSYLFGGQPLSIAGIYSDTLQSSSSCDSIVTLSLNVNPIITDSISASICSGDFYLFGGQQIFVSGFYSDTLQSSSSCDSAVTLILNVNSIITDSISASICFGNFYLFGGEQLSVAGVYIDTLQSSTLCDSIVTLTLNVNPIITDSISASICFGDFYLFGGQQLSVSGVYSDTLQSSSSCDSIITLMLNVNPIITDSISASICSGDSYLFGGQQISVAGVYSDTLQSSLSCDSIITLFLNVNPVITDSISASICSGDFYLFGVQQLSVAGIYSDTLQSSSNCDSVVTLTLNVNPIITDSISVSICNGDSYLFDGQQLSVSGVYSDTLQSNSSCDSIITLILNVNPIITDSISASICSGDFYLFGGQQLSVAGIYTDTLQSSSSCDSVVTLTLNVNPMILDSISASICSGSFYLFGGQQLSVAGVYSDTLQSSTLCDSIVTLMLNVNPIIMDSISGSICSGDFYLFGGQQLSVSGVYNDTLQSSTLCDSIVTLMLNVNPIIMDSISASICFGDSYLFGGQQLSVAGIYTDTLQSNSSCDSIVTLTLNVNPIILDSISASICFGSSYLFGGQQLSVAGVYSDTFQSSSSCDSIITLTLSIHSLATTITIDTGACGNLYFENQTYTNSVSWIDTVYSVLGCDSIYRIIDISIYNAPLTVITFDTAACDNLIFNGEEYAESTTIENIYKDIHGCDSLKEVIHIVIHYSVRDTIDVLICNGESYDFNGNSYYDFGIYNSVFSQNNGCDSISTLILTVQELPNLQIKIEPRKDFYCIGDEIQLIGQGANQYFWTDFEDVDLGSADYLKTILIKQNNPYFVKGIDQWGCENKTNIDIEAEACCSVFVPTAFSPNNDGLNDQFGVQTLGNPKSFSLQIFNRYGEKVFVSYRKEDMWDGKINGKDAAIGTYFYILSGKCADGTMIKQKGDVTLMR